MNDSYLNTDEVSAERLAKWRRRLAAAHATPLLLMAIGHDHTSGEITICTTEEMDVPTMCMLLQEAIDRIGKEVAARARKARE